MFRWRWKPYNFTNRVRAAVCRDTKHTRHGLAVANNRGLQCGDLSARQSWEEFAEQARRAQGIVRDIYADLEDGYEIPLSEEIALRSTGCSDVYGELKPESAMWLIREIDAGAHDVFCDLGCGVGKVLIYTVLTGSVRKAVGLELSETRANIAREAIRRAGFEDRCLVYCENLMESTQLQDATICYCANTVFPRTAVDSITRKMAMLPHLRLWLTMQAPSCFVLSGAFEESGTLHLDTTWNQRTSIRMYKPLSDNREIV